MQSGTEIPYPQTAVLLAGGKGTRLGLVDRPKPLVLVDHRTLLEFQIEWLAQQGIKKVFLLLNYMPDMIRQEIGSGNRWQLAIEYLVESEPLGTSGALAQLKGQLNTDFYVIYGDLFSAFLDLKSMFRFHYFKQADLTLLTHPNDHPYDSDLVEADANQQVTRFLTKPHPKGLVYSNLVNAAVYIFTPNALKHLETNVFQDLARDVFPRWLKQMRVFSYKTFEYVKDIGTPDRIEKLKRELVLSKTPQRKRLVEKKPCVFWDRDGTLVEYVKDLTQPAQIKLREKIEEPIKFLNSLGVLNIVVTNQPGIAKGQLTYAELSEIHKTLETDLGNQRAWLDEIYFCPHHPERGFAGEVPELKGPCDCRKPSAGMLLQAAAAYNIDFTMSFLVGDTERDRRAAEAVGIGFIAMLGGQGEPDQIRPNVFETKEPSELTHFFSQFFKSKGIYNDCN